MASAIAVAPPIATAKLRPILEVVVIIVLMGATTTMSTLTLMMARLAVVLRGLGTGNVRSRWWIGLIWGRRIRNRCSLRSTVRGCRVNVAHWSCMSLGAVSLIKPYADRRPHHLCSASVVVASASTSRTRILSVGLMLWMLATPVLRR